MRFYLVRCHHAAGNLSTEAMWCRGHPETHSLSLSLGCAGRVEQARQRQRRRPRPRSRPVGPAGPRRLRAQHPGAVWQACELQRRWGGRGRRRNPRPGARVERRRRERVGAPGQWGWPALCQGHGCYVGVAGAGAAALASLGGCGGGRTWGDALRSHLCCPVCEDTETVV